MILLTLLTGWLAAPGRAQAQTPAVDTLRVMHFNILNYGNNVTGCTPSNNGLAVKDAAFRTIIAYSPADILTVNELGATAGLENRIATAVLNADGRAGYMAAPTTNGAGSSIINGLFYRSDKLVLVYNRRIVVSTRDINHYRLYTLPVAPGADTTFINVIVAHLKAGNTVSDRTQRDQQTAGVISYLTANPLPAGEAMLMSGDFNVYQASEAGYQNLVRAPAGQPTPFFQDPINREGNWTGNRSFADVHTQSPRSSSNGCATGGGMDDRFDFILMSPSVLGVVGSAPGPVRYVPGSYQALGNDGQRFRSDINGAGNVSAPGAVLDAIHSMSDHLPVQAKLIVTRTQSVARALPASQARLWTDAPGQIYLVGGPAPLPPGLVTLHTTTGRLLASAPVPALPVAGPRATALSLAGLPAGAYLITGAWPGYAPLRRLVVHQP